MKQYRIYTEEKNIELIQEEVAACFASFTVYSALGSWRDTAERSCVIEIITHESNYALLTTLAKSIKRLNNQQAVWLTKQDIEVTVL